MATYKGILSFPALFTPKLAKGATEPNVWHATVVPYRTDPRAGASAR